MLLACPPLYTEMEIQEALFRPSRGTANAYGNNQNQFSHEFRSPNGIIFLSDDENSHKNGDDRIYSPSHFSQGYSTQVM